MVKTENKDVFDVLHPKVKEIAKERFGRATQVQNLAVPKILQGKNILTIAGTGFGKTEAVMLPVFSLWLKESPRQYPCSTFVPSAPSTETCSSALYGGPTSLTWR